MASQKKQTEEEEIGGAPEWMVTFSDCMTLLLTFFVLLLSFSSFDNQAFKQMNQSLVNQFSELSYRTRREKEAFKMREQVSATDDINVGSEHPTEETNTIGNLKSGNSADYRDQKVFFVPSEDIFWGNGSTLTPNGKETLSIIAEYLKNFPNRFVIYEGTHTGKSTDYSRMGIERTWQAINLIAEKGNIDKNRFSIASATTLPKQAQTQYNITQDRLLEIVMLERSVCK